MRVLCVNDDGVYAVGIYEMAKALKEDGHEVTIVAPNSQRTGAGHGMTYFEPIEIFDVKLPGLEDVPTFAISGTPVDCVRLGAGTLAPRPDLIVSGINTGTNLGCDIYASGTVNSAFASIEKGIPTIAMSVSKGKPQHADVAAQIGIKAIHELLPKVGGGLDTVISINVPDLPKEEIKGVKVTPIARVNPNYRFTEEISPRNHRFYWDAAEALNLYEPDEDVDEQWLKNGYVTVSPLRLDIVDYKALAFLKEDGAEYIL